MKRLPAHILFFLLCVQPAFAQYLNLIPDSRVVLDYGAAVSRRPTALIIYALPNGNTIEWTAGKQMEPGDDWHYDIQHIRAQTEFIRAADTTRNYVVAYLEAAGKAWTAHAAKYRGEVTEQNPQALHSYALYPALVDSLERLVAAQMGCPVTEVILGSHSGGGRFVFDYLSGVKQIPDKISRLFLIDSNYGFEDSLHTEKLTHWLKNVPQARLAVFAYVDTTVVLNGKPIVSATGGTGYKTEQMYWALGREQAFGLVRQADTAFVTMNSADGRILLLKKENPQGKIYHTVLVERNGFIHAVLFATPLDEKGYRFWTQGRGYTDFIK